MTIIHFTAWITLFCILHYKYEDTVKWTPLQFTFILAGIVTVIVLLFTLISVLPNLILFMILVSSFTGVAYQWNLYSMIPTSLRK